MFLVCGEPVQVGQSYRWCRVTGVVFALFSQISKHAATLGDKINSVLASSNRFLLKTRRCCPEELKLKPVLFRSQQQHTAVVREKDPE